MATRLDKLVTSIKSRLTAGGVNVPHLTDALALTRHQERRRVVWLTDGGRIKPSTRTSGGYGDNGRKLTMAATREEHVWVYCYAETRAVAEQLLDNVIVALSQHLETPSWQDYSWRTQEDGEAGHIQRCECARLRFSLPLPVPDYITPLITDDYVNTVGDPVTTVLAADEQGTFSAAEPAPWPDNGEDL
jgi:predicted NAD/FAD-dependent oxidoreductase